MKKRHALPLLACSLLVLPAQAADPKDEIAPAVAAPEEPSVPISQEFTMEGSYTGKSTMKQGSASIGGVGNANGHVNYVASPQIKDGFLLRFGFDAERNSFDLPAAAPLPNTLQSVNAILGVDLALGDKIIMRAEAHPGVYGDFVHLTGNSFDCPVQIGGTYLFSKDFQLIFGLQIDPKSDFPIIGLPGFRWQFADQWVLSAIPPKPQLQYELSNAVTLYTGMEILSGTYQLNNQFGSNHGHGPAYTSQFNNNVCDFTEVRVGAGVTWKFTPNLTLDVSGGYMPYREFNIHSSRIEFNPDSTTFHNSLGDGAPYAEAGISGSF